MNSFHKTQVLVTLGWIFFVLFVSNAHSQSIEFKHLGVKEGLANGTAYASVQDTRGFMWIGTADGLNRYDTRELRSYRHDPDNPASVSNDRICSLFSDSKGTLWVGTYVGLNRYDPVKDAFEQPAFEGAHSAELNKAWIICMTEDEAGNLWAGTGEGLYCIKSVNGKNIVRKFLFENIFPAGNVRINDLYADHQGAIWTSLPDGIARLEITGNRPVYAAFRFKNTSKISNTTHATRICGDKKGNIWVASLHNGLTRFNSKTGDFQDIPGWVKWKQIVSHISAMLTDQTGTPWIATNEGIFKYDTQTGQVHNYAHDPTNEKSLRDNYVTHLYQDQTGNLWVSSYTGGISHSLGITNPFVQLSRNYRGTSAFDKITGTPTGDILLISENHGIHRLDKSTNRFSPIAINTPKPWQVTAIHSAKSGRIWVALASGLLLMYVQGPDGLREVHRFQFSQYRFSSFYILSIMEDSREQVWLGTTYNGLHVFNWRTSELADYNTAAHDKLGLTDRRVTCLLEDSKNNVWAGYHTGVRLFENGGRKSKWIPSQKEPSPIGKGMVSYIHEDRQNRIWISRYYLPVRLYNPQTGKLDSVSELEALPNPNSDNMLSDELGSIWFSNELGLVRYRPENKSTKQYYFSDGIPGSEILHESAYQAPNGEMFYATNTGAIRFFPKKVPVNKQPPPVAFTALRLFNKRVQVGDQTGVLNREIAETKEITLDHTKSIFSVDFAVLGFYKPEQNQYAYKLEGFDEDWNYVNTPTATYTNLPSGTYTLLAKGANSDATWNTKGARLLITVLPPWWNTWYAWLTYVFLFAFLLYSVMRMFWIRSTFRKEVQLQQDKLDFFNNISHEIRTHLTLINGPVEILLKNKKGDTEVQHHLRLAKDTSERLLNLVGELMDFRKLESGTVRLRVGQQDIVPFLKNILSSFHHFAESMAIESIFVTNSDSVMVWYDPDQLQKVVYNLLMNSYKFTQRGGNVTLSLQETDDHVDIKILDNGRGISPEHLGKLFTNYFQVYDYGQQNTGYGLGLALSKQIIQLHKGSLTVTSREYREGVPGRTEFTATLLKGHSHFDPDHLTLGRPAMADGLQTIAKDSEAWVKEDNGKNVILLVEDNEQVRGFVSEALKETYQVVETQNGAQGWQWAIENIPDLIISDVMMAEMDGIELCGKLKNDHRTSHIPVILLTAKATTQQQLDGLESGAEEYITKPFSIQILLSKIRNLLKARETMQLRYRSQVSLGSQKLEVRNPDEKFLSQIIEFVENNMEDRNLGVMEISRHIGMSKSALYRKLKAMTQMTTNDFVTMIRLERASQLLSQKHLNINEISRMVGFESRKYFSKIFKQRFGKNPREYSGRQEVEGE